MQQFIIREENVRALVGADTAGDAAYYGSRKYFDAEILSLKVEPFPASLEGQRDLTEQLKEHHPTALMFGHRLYFVTLQARYLLEIPDVNASPNDGGLDQQPGVPVARDSEVESEGGTHSRFRGPPTEA